MVSPDWLIDTTSVRSLRIGLRYRNSCDSSTSTGNARPLLDRVLAEHARVCRGAAGDDDHAVDLVDGCRERLQLVELRDPVVNPPQQGVRDRLGLLGDLLRHEARPAALLAGGGIPGHLERLGLDVGAREVDDLDRIGADRHDLVLPDRDGAMRELDERRDIRSEEVLPIAEPDHEGRVAAGADHDARGILVHHEQRERALESVDDRTQRSGQVARLAVRVAHEDRGHLGVGLAREVRVGWQLGLELGVVLDDPVVDEGELAVIPEVRMRVPVVRRPVRRPAGVTDARAPIGNGGGLEIIEQHLQLAGALSGRHRAIRTDDRNAGGVVAAVLEALESAEQHLEALLAADVAHDSTHGLDSRPVPCAPSPRPGPRSDG